MFVVQDFIRWALLHVHKATIPQGAKLAVPAALCGIEPWEYLFGSIRVPTTPQVLDAYYKNRYSQIMTRAEFDAITSAWPTNTYATDCQGLLDAWLTYEMDYPTDINAQANYALWCTQKGRIEEISRPYVMGEAVFRSDPAGRMTHVGWICGKIGGEPLIVEARGIRFGVVVSKLSERNFDFRGLMKNMFSYKEDAKMPVKRSLQNR